MPSRIRKIVSGSQRVTLILVVTTAALLIGATAIIFSQSRAPRFTKIKYSELYQIAETGSAASLVIENDTLIVQSKQGTSLQATVSSDAIRQGLVEQFRKNNVPIEFRPVETTWAATLLTWRARSRGKQACRFFWRRVRAFRKSLPVSAPHVCASSSRRARKFRPVLFSSTRLMPWAGNADAAATRPAPIRIKHSINC